MTTRPTWYVLLAASILCVGCSDSPVRNTLAPSSVPDFAASASAISASDPADADPDMPGASEATEAPVQVSIQAHGVSDAPMILKAAACVPKITGPSRISERFIVTVTPCASTWTLDADYLTRNGNWWNSSILVNQYRVPHWSRVNQAAGTRVTVDLSKLPAASSATTFRLTLTAAGRTATYRFTYNR